MKPSAALWGGRIPFTTKEVGRGFYRGNRTGALGAHTEYGGYVIDYRKVRHFNVPDLTDFKLTPFVTKSINPRGGLPIGPDNAHYEPKKVDAVEFLRMWRDQNPHEYQEWREAEMEKRELALEESRAEEETYQAVQPQQKQLYTPVRPETRTTP